MTTQQSAKGYVLDIYEQAVEYIDNVLTEEYGPEVTAEFNKIKPILNEKLNGFSDYNYCQLFIIPDNSDYTEYITKQQAVNRLTTALCHLSIKLLNGYKLIDVTIENSLHFKIEPEGTFTFNVFN